ncbi:hypothetical protein QM806_38600 [Rhodococcus sp. IEGM 1351]|uniref:hypothetical protein n=1 Tax=Rhodococcus sp. IEGM 1351 TaxID=3047089 RepID=UPI0024B6F9BE|nr:hypothetical protein [Rhodococcus sp. IEGM 1351]MDI9941262.1 hypothetical protein [Rhodococcus sp. IEGM 1351]
MSTSDGDPVGVLEWSESVALAAMQVSLMQSDLDATTSGKSGAVKDAVLGDAVEGFRRVAAEGRPDRPEWLTTLVGEMDTQETAAAADAIADQGRRLPRLFGSRERSLLVLVNLILFDPWPAKASWHAATRRTALEALVDDFPHLDRTDLDRMRDEHTLLLRRLRRKSVHWGKVAFIGAAGLAAGVATGGWAAPVIGAAIGSAAGLTGAAATSAGLATLGGGAIAAGGFGIAGGTALVTGLGGIAGASVAAAGARWTPWTTGQVVADAMRLDLIARCVLIEAENRDEKQRRVVQSLQERLEKVVADGERLLDRIRELSRENARLTAENKELREELRRQHADAKRAEGALEVILDRLPETAAL